MKLTLKNKIDLTFFAVALTISVLIITVFNRTEVVNKNRAIIYEASNVNTLIKKVGDQKYTFYLVDLNRMNFHTTMDFDMRMKNLSRLTPKKEMIAIMSEEYAKFYPQSKEIVFEKMWFFTQDFQQKFAKKQRLKKKLKFWKA